MVPPSGLRLTLPPVTGNANFAAADPWTSASCSVPGATPTGTMPFSISVRAMPGAVVTVVVPPLSQTDELSPAGAFVLAGALVLAEAAVVPSSGARSRPAPAAATARRPNTRMLSPFVGRTREGVRAGRGLRLQSDRFIPRGGWRRGGCARRGGRGRPRGAR